MNGCSCKPHCKCIHCKCGSYARIFDALGHPTRLRIISLLQQRPHNVSEIVEETGIEQTCASHCLRTLEKNGFVVSRKEGRFRVYELKNSAIDPFTQIIKQVR